MGRATATATERASVPRAAARQSPRRVRALPWWALLGAAQVALAIWLVLVELGQPLPEPGFGGIAFSNAISSPRARASVDLFRERLGWPRDVAAPEEWRRLSPAAYLWAKRVGVVALALVQVIALVRCLHGRPDRGGPLWRWLAGPALALAILLLMPPVSSDVFYYAAAGTLAQEGANPYLTAPQAVAAAAPFAPFDDWAHITTPYGPVWTAVSRLVVGIAGAEPFRATIGFKVVAALAVLALGAVTALVARRLTGSARIAAAALILVAWHPALLLESAGSAHLDAPMMLLTVAGLVCVVAERPGGIRSGLVLIAAGALVKPVVAPLLGLAAMRRLAPVAGRPVTPRRLALAWVGDTLAIVALLVIAFRPYWSGGDLLRVAGGESKRLYLDEALGVNAVWFWLAPRLPLVPEGDPWLEITHNVVRPLTVAATLAILTGALLWLIGRSWSRGYRGRAPAPPGGDSRDQVLAWAAATAALGLLPVNAHAWYAIWPLAPVALAWAVLTPLAARGGGAERAPGGPERVWLPWWLWLFLVWTSGAFLVYHTHVWPGPDAG